MTTSQLYGLRPGGTAASVRCPAGQWMTGFRVGENGAIQRWAGIYCQAPQGIAQNQGGALVPVNAGGGGRDVDFQCPAGSYLSGVLTEYDDGVRRLTPTCTSLAGGQTTARDVSIGTQSGREPTFLFACGAYDGVDTTADSVLRQVRYHCSGDATRVRQNFYTPEGKARCCMGLEGQCQMRPQSGECDRFMSTEFCPANPTHPFCSCLRSPVPCPNKFDGRCITNSGYRTQDMLQAPCPDVITCQQFVTFGPEAQALATRVEQNCPNANPANKQALQEAPLPATSVLAGSGWWWVLLLILLVLVALGAGLWIALGDEEEAPPEEVQKAPAVAARV